MMKRFSLLAGGRVRKTHVPWVRTTCDQLYFLFQGHRQDLGQDRPSFVRKTGLVDRNFVFFRDATRRRYQHGISDDVPSISALVRWQQNYVRSQSHVRRTFTIGTSYGGYAALLFGHLVGVETVWAFAPVTALLACRTQFGDLAEVLSRSNGKTEYRVYFNRHNGPDVRAAHRIQHCDGVKLFPQPGSRHDVAIDLERAGALETLLPPLTP